VFSLEFIWDYTGSGQKINGEEKLKERFAILILVFLIAFAVSSQTVYGLYETPEPWPMWRYDLARTGATTSTAPNTNMTIWSSENIYTTCTPIVVDGKVLVTGSGNKLYALDETTGVVLWQSFALTGSLGGNIAYSNGTVYVGTTDGYLYSINATTGEKIHEYNISPAHIYTTPAVAYGKVFFGATNGYLYALNASTLLLKWYYTAGGQIRSSPTIYGDMLYFGCDDGKVYALDISNDAGPTLKWRYTTGGQIRSSPCVGGGKVYIGSSSTDHSIFALNATTTNSNGETIWKWTILSGYAIETSPAFYNDILYVTAPLQKAYALYTNGFIGNFSENDPIKKWSATVGTYPGTPAVADGKMFFSTNDHNLYALDTEDGHMVWIKNFGVSSPYEPVIADGRLFVSDYYKVYCVGNYYPPLTYYYTVNPLGHSYVIKLVIANGTPSQTIDVTRLINPPHAINYTVIGIEGTIGMCNITIPNEMMDGEYTVRINGGLPLELVITHINDTHTSLYFTYYQSINAIEITGTTVVPEFPSTIMLPLLLALSLIAVTLAKKKPSRN
jgi:outer membrane protein assembly factor BamB